MVTKSLKKPVTHFPHHNHHRKLSLPSQATTTVLLKKPPGSLLPVQGEDLNLLQLPIHLLLPGLYLNLPLQSLLQHPQSHLQRGGRGETVRALTQAHTYTSARKTLGFTHLHPAATLHLLPSLRCQQCQYQYQQLRHPLCLQKG